MIFTAGGTEANNLALKGLYWARRGADDRRRRILASAVEHHAVIDPVQWLVEPKGLKSPGCRSTHRGGSTPTRCGRSCCDTDTVALVSIMWANNEVGTVQPIEECAALARAAGVPIHTDAVQAAGVLPVISPRSGVDALTISGHKFGGPLGVGALLLSRDVTPVPLMHGGGQERDVRSGTLDTPAIAGLRRCQYKRPQSDLQVGAKQVGELRDDLVRRLLLEVPDAVSMVTNVSTPATACQGTRMCPSPDARATRCSCCSTLATSAAPPDRLVPPGSPSQVTSCSRWVA